MKFAFLLLQIQQETGGPLFFIFLESKLLHKKYQFSLLLAGFIILLTLNAKMKDEVCGTILFVVVQKCPHDLQWYLKLISINITWLNICTAGSQTFFEEKNLFYLFSLLYFSNLNELELLCGIVALFRQGIMRIMSLCT